MLYPTHKRYGLFSGLLGIPLAVNLGLFPILSLNLKMQENVLILFLLCIGIFSAFFGSEFPDCDSYGGYKADGTFKKGSIPSQKHPLISKIFKSFGVKHRGKFSHDYASIFLFISIVWTAQFFIFKTFTKILETSNNFVISFLVNLIAFAFVLWLVNDLRAMYKFKKGKKLFNGNVLNILSVFLVFVIYGSLLLTNSISWNWLDSTNALNVISFVKVASNVFIFFFWMGAYSHLFADMMTNEGVSIFGKRLAPAKIVLKVEKFPFTILGIPVLMPVALGAFSFYRTLDLKMMAIGVVLGAVIQLAVMKTDLKTGSGYEDLCFIFVTFLCIPAGILAVISITGGNFQTFVELFSFLQ